MNKVSKGYFLGTIGVGFGLTDLLLLMGAITAHTDGPHEGAPLLGLAVLVSLGVGVVLMVLFYKMWAAIQDAYVRTSPGKAVGFLLIPFFNVYWAFQAIWGFAKDYNRFVARHGVIAMPLPDGLFLAYTILTLTTWLPGIGVVLQIVRDIVGVCMVAKICDGVNALPARAGAAAGPMGREERGEVISPHVA